MGGYIKLKKNQVLRLSILAKQIGDAESEKRTIYEEAEKEGKRKRLLYTQRIVCNPQKHYRRIGFTDYGAEENSIEIPVYIALVRFPCSQCSLDLMVGDVFLRPPEQVNRKRSKLKLPLCRACRQIYTLRLLPQRGVRGGGGLMGQLLRG